ncbi:hypothetical protein IFM47457_05501 [Aspergillus lentulus]|nr:hypothetical protein IFM47457_05501 [Aspergillus lentulus]
MWHRGHARHQDIKRSSAGFVFGTLGMRSCSARMLDYRSWEGRTGGVSVPVWSKMPGTLRRNGKKKARAPFRSGGGAILERWRWPSMRH